MKRKTKCQKCGSCCQWRTCIPTPSELEEIAKFFKITIEGLIEKYFCIDIIQEDIFYVKPAGINQTDLLGKFIPSRRTWNEGKCIFLTDDNLCKIYEVRPKTAKIQKCWIHQKPDNSIFDYWKNNKLEEIYPKWKKMKEGNVYG